MKLENKHKLNFLKVGAIFLTLALFLFIIPNNVQAANKSHTFTSIFDISDNITDFVNFSKSIVKGFKQITNIKHQIADNYNQGTASPNDRSVGRVAGQDINQESDNSNQESVTTQIIRETNNYSIRQMEYRRGWEFGGRKNSD